MTVLHHTLDPETLLDQAKRVARRIIVMEDVYSNVIQKYATFIMDSVVNFEFIGHPHANKSHSQWLEIFNKLELKIIKSESHSFWKFFTSNTYLLEKAQFNLTDNKQAY